MSVKGFVHVDQRDLALKTYRCNMQDSQTDEETGAPCMEVEKQPMLPPWEPQQRHDASTDRIQGPADTSLE